MTYLQAVEELSALLESATIEYEYEVLAEAGGELVPTQNSSGDESSDKSSLIDKAKNGAVAAGKKIKAIIHKLWEVVKNLAKKLWDFIQRTVAKDNGHAPLTVSTDTDSVLAITKPKEYANAVIKLKSLIMNTSRVITDEDINAVLEFINVQVKLEAGKPLNAKLKDYQDASNVVSKVVDQLDHMPIHDAIGAEGITMIGKAASAISKTFATFVSGVSKLVVLDDENKRTNAANKKGEMDKKNAHATYINQRDGFGNVIFQNPHGESIEYMATKARLLEEAATLYGEMAKLAGEKTLVEDAHSEPVPGTQKEIEDIPEETPVVAKEYPEDTSGGEGKQEDQLEATKELVDGDSKAMDLLTKNDQSKTITESIDLVFDL